MILKTLKGHFDGPRRNYVISSDLGEEEMISPSQRRTLTNLVFQRCDSDERERWLANLPDMTRYDAEEAIFNFLKMGWS
jgi:hypothetical protein